MRKVLLILAFISFLLPACGAKPPKFESGLPPLKAHLDCLPRDVAMISAHRATARDWNLPENAFAGLTKLSKGKYLMAEIDVAKTTNGTHFIFHDGVWDEVSTGKGPVARADDVALERVLLKSRSGRLSNERPPLLKDVLEAAKTLPLYLEVDFKSSANYGVVIDQIREAGMAEQVILISYTSGQRERLKKLAPEMLISASANYAKNGDLIWAGKDATRQLPKRLNKKTIIGKVSKPSNTEGLKLAIAQSSILVTDDANKYLPITGLNAQNKPDYEACLSKIK